MNEEKIRKAADVATDVVKFVPEHAYAPVWVRVFDAMVYEPNLDNMTAAGIEALRDAEDRK